MTDSEDRATIFVRLLQENSHRLATYVHAAIPSWADAEDVLQETSVRLWQEFDRFELGTNFGAWACTVARYLIMTYRKKNTRHRLQFSPEVIDLIAAEIDRSEQERDPRLEQLPKCIEQLSEGNRELLAMCYASNLKIKEVATVLNRSTNATYLAVSRVRRWLHECVERHLSREETGRI